MKLETLQTMKTQFKMKKSICRYYTIEHTIAKQSKSKQQTLNR